MKPPPFSYYDPRSVAEAIDLLARLDNARLLAGGQSLMAMLNLRFAFPDHLIDLNKIDELIGVERQGGEIRIGAMTRQRDIQANALIREHLPLLIEALDQVGHRQTRNRGTIGGSLCHLDPTAELVAVANNLDATVDIRGPAGARRLPLTDFTVGFMTTALEPTELVIAVRFPLPPARHTSSFVEMARRHGDFAIVSVATTMVYDEVRDRIDSAAITVGGLGPVPQRLPEAERILVQAEPRAEHFEQAAQVAGNLEALGDALVPGWYRQKVAVVMVRRALSLAHERHKDRAPSRMPP